MIAPMERKISRLEVKERLYRRRYFLPNAVTVGNMFCGFLSIIYATSGRFEKASFAILFAILLDGLDGRVARRLNATSKFGLEFDSLSDLISFGVAPAILLYQWCFQQGADEFGVVVSFVYCVCAASRLARFNVTDTKLHAFEGLPSPGAAGMMAALAYTAPEAAHNDPWLIAVGAGVTLLTGYLMVSRIEFRSIKQLRIENMHVVARILSALTIVLIWYKPKLGFVALAGCYCLSGPVAEMLRELRAKRSGRRDPLKIASSDIRK